MATKKNLTQLAVRLSFDVNRTTANPKFFWTARGMRLYVDTQPRPHSWGVDENDIRPVLDNIAAAAHACNLHKDSWVRECFASPQDARRFLRSLGEFKGHLNSYWFYGLLSLLEAEEHHVHTTALMAQQLTLQAVETRQIQVQSPMCQTSAPISDVKPSASLFEVDRNKSCEETKRKMENSTDSCNLDRSKMFGWVKAWLD